MRTAQPQGGHKLMGGSGKQMRGIRRVFKDVTYSKLMKQEHPKLHIIAMVYPMART